MRCCVFVCLYTHSSCCWVVRERRERKDGTHKGRRGEERIRNLKGGVLRSLFVDGLCTRMEYSVQSRSG